MCPPVVGIAHSPNMGGKRTMFLLDGLVGSPHSKTEMQNNWPEGSAFGCILDWIEGMQLLWWQMIFPGCIPLFLIFPCYWMRHPL